LKYINIDNNNIGIFVPFDKKDEDKREELG